MKTELQIAKMMLVSKKTIDAALREGSKNFLAQPAMLMASGMIVACNWIILGGEDPPGYDKISDADAFAYLEEIKDAKHEKPN